MASAELRDELKCSICQSLYTDPVSLRCGHKFCPKCFGKVQDTSHGSGGYSCPVCNDKYLDGPPLEKKMILEKQIFCTYCIKSSVPAVKSCLQCEISLCDDHLKDHNKLPSMDHKLIEPTDSFNNKECSIHKKALEYYCPEDSSFLCVFCCLAGEHKGHQVERLEEASEKKKLRKYLDELNPQKAEIQTRVQNLQEHKRNIQEKASNKRENVSKIFMDIKKQLEMAEKKALSEISRQEEKIVSEISDLIRRLEIKEDELSSKMCHLEEMCHVTDPIRLLQERDITVCGHGDGEDTGGDGGKIKSTDGSDVQVSDTKVQDDRADPNAVLHESDQGAALSNKSMAEEESPVSDPYEKADDPDETADDPDETADDPDETADDPDETADDLDETADDLDETADDLDEVLISLTLHRSMRDIITNVTSQLGFHVPDILLDEDTANKDMKLSEDLKTATNVEEDLDRPESPGRFLSYCQVLSRCGLSSGRHYWEVEWNQIGRCDIGMSYPSIERKGKLSGIGDNDKSWCLIMENTEYFVSHKSVTVNLHSNPTCPSLGVFLDYEAGRLSFYELCDPIRHLHTFTASFTEPLHVIFYVYEEASVAITSKGQ